ncbi:MAG: hypothetical protein K2L18_05785, partial [Acetatifactor sp.]|nr:hypothetical protein [Acetatifactor sp.]
QLREELFEYGFMEATPQELQESRDRLFRPLLVDGLAMMKLLKQQELVIWLEAIQRQYLSILKRSQTVRLADEIDYLMIDKSIERIVEIVISKMQERTDQCMGPKRPDVDHRIYLSEGNMQNYK